MATSPDGFKSKIIFDEITSALKADGATLVGKVKGIYGFKVKGGPGGTEGYWIVDAKNGSGSVVFNGTEKPDVTLIMTDSDLLDLMTGKLNSQKAFFQGKLKVQGNMGLAMKLSEFQKKAPKAKL
ncbi:non-specific lipid-transfer protein [Eurytemora carolleeae]|uniref:non-specific lipid-transfer protein n=1 Tax=Eurytemora carolleeae TaxID=1294199 RepID=UPI000C765995|nr:non-specific lipid-transfer protein [Eurytemora carolleeae]|eukprot:XP_023335511.1 non-specific lipid-transfer protein-like [Eurytemora affinis]